MTNQEAISILKTWRVTGDKEHEALEMAFSALQAAEIIRCKDCRWYGFYSCKLHGNSWMRDGNGYCDRAERRTDGYSDKQTGGN